MTPEQSALRAAYLAELWPTCRELSAEERSEKRKSDRRTQRVLDDMHAVHNESTGCAETGDADTSQGAA